MMEQVRRLCDAWPLENWLGSSLNQIQRWTTVRESYSRALEQGSLPSFSFRRRLHRQHRFRKYRLGVQWRRMGPDKLRSVGRIDMEMLTDRMVDGSLLGNAVTSGAASSKLPADVMRWHGAGRR